MEDDRWRFLEMEVDSYAEATMSLSPAIAKACENGHSAETMAMFVHRYQSIVMGRQNDPDVDINYPFCQKEKIIVKRVPTPGTIFGHPGYIMTVLYIRKERLPDAISEVFEMINNKLASAFSGKWGVMARHRPLNDLEVQIHGSWKKVGPFSISFFGPFICCRIGLTVTPIPYDIVEKALPGPPEKFADKAEKSVSERVGSLEEALGRTIKIEEVKEVVKEAISEIFNVSFYRGAISEKEREYEIELRRLYDKDEWFWANSIKRRFPFIPEGAMLLEHSEKIPQGPLIRARVLKKGDDLIDCSLTGWYHGVRPLDALEIIESKLKGERCKEETIKESIEKAYREGNIQIDKSTPYDFAKVIMKAIEEGKKLK